MAHNKNKGFSLIELVVTIAIMAVVTGAAISIFSWLNSGKLKTSYKGITSAMDEVRTDSMAKEKDIYLRIGKSGDTYYTETVDVSVGTVLSKTDLGKAEVFATSAGTDLPLTGGNVIMLKYSKTNGKFVNRIIGTTLSSITNVTGIYVKYGNLSKRITLINTGKYKVSNE